MTIFDRISKHFQRLDVPRGPLPENFTRSAPETDDSEMIVADQPVRSKLDGWVICLEYEDAKGQHSTRDVECRSYKTKGGFEYLLVHCFVREKLRLFRLDRVISVIDYDTGEVFSPPTEFFGYLRTITGTNSRAGEITNSFFEAADLARLLVFVARANRKFVQIELDAINLILQQEISFPTNLKGKNKAVQVWLKSLKPSAESAARSLLRIRKNPEKAQKLVPMLREVIWADGVYQKEEEAALNELNELVLELEA
ncbi:MAG: hypothetical protein COA52_12920 [Hyphomicrobiales bacterium]|nr:MAG: hypothetical protein COA52_12920 [Hyphomicrobiales bacterium]